MTYFRVVSKIVTTMPTLIFFFINIFEENFERVVDLLLWILGAFSLVEDEKLYQRRMTTIPFRKNSWRRHRFFIPYITK